MEFFGKVKESFSAAGQDVAKKAKTATESMRMNNQIKANEKMADKLLYQVGKLFFNEHCDGEVGETYQELFQEILRLQSENKSLAEQIEALNTEKVCPNCGRANTVDVNFCVNCGTNLKNVEVVKEQEAVVQPQNCCPQCGAPYENDALFCMECGTKLGNTGAVSEPVVEEQPQNICPKCGEPYEEDALFCMECGCKLMQTTDNE